jgi:phage terminase small subunit
MQAKTPKLALVKATGGPKPPRKLGTHGAALWRSVHAEYQIEDTGGLELLALACESLDRSEACKEQINAEGQVLKTKSGWREHPLLKHETQARALAARLLGRLGLDVEALRSGPGRPTSMRGFTGDW